MKIFDEINKINTGCQNLSNFFSTLYYIKRYMLMIENIHGEASVSMNIEQIKSIQDKINETVTLQELNFLAKFYELALKDIIPIDRIEAWSVGDYEEFTDKYHHRKFWGEIENSPIIDMFIEQFCKIYGKYKIYTDENRDDNICMWNLRLYDFNDYELYFVNQEDLESFTDDFDLEPYSVYSRSKTKDCPSGWFEEYSA